MTDGGRKFCEFLIQKRAQSGQRQQNGNNLKYAHGAINPWPYCSNLPLFPTRVQAAFEAQFLFPQGALGPHLSGWYPYLVVLAIFAS